MNSTPPHPVDPRPPPGSYAETRDAGELPPARPLRVPDVAQRGWPSASTRSGRVASGDARRQGELLRKHAPDLADPDAAIRLIREIAPQRFFAGVTHPGTRDALAARLPQHPAELVTGADAIVSRPDAPARRGGHDFGDAEVSGDDRRVGEQRRHQWLVRLAQAWSLTGDERYARVCANAIDTWIERNPPGIGVNGARGDDASLQLIAWCWTLMLLRDSPVISPARVHRLLTAIWVLATGVERHLSHAGPRNIDLTSQALGLFYTSTLFREFREAARWRELSIRTLVAESEAQICEDGVHVEQSTCCHRYSIDTHLHVLLLAERNGIALPAPVHQRVRRMLEFLLAVRQTDGTIPSIGDDDGRTLFPLTDRATADSRGVFAVAATIFGRGDFAWAAGGLAPEVLWLMGPDGARAFDAIDATPPTSEASRVFPSGGYAVMRSGWEPAAHQVMVDFGPIGGPGSAGHGHADLLSIQCTIFGEPCLVDAGSDASTDDPRWREFFRSATVHSTIMIDGVNQAEPVGQVGWRNQPRARLRHWHSAPAFDFLDAEHDGYLSLPDPVVHRRRVVFIKPGYWILVDDLSGAARHQVDLAFQFGSLDLTLGTHPWARAQTPGGRVLWISPFPSAPAHSSLTCGQLAPLRGWISREYGERQPAPMLNYRYDVALPWRIVTLLLPDRQGLAVPPVVRAIYDDAGRPTGLAFERPRRVVRFNDRAVSVARK